MDNITTQPPNEPTKMWAIVELFGHQKMAGEVSTHQIGGASFIRIDCPETKDQPAYTRTLNPKAIYALNWCDEEAARIEAERSNPSPINSYSMRQAVRQAIERETVATLGEGDIEQRRNRHPFDGDPEDII
jgi:hypothetical protein